MNIETEMNPTYVIRISKAEAHEAAKNPSELVKLLNSALGYKARRAAQPKATRAVKRSAKKAHAQPGKRGGLKCRWCQRRFTNKGWLNRNEPKCDQRDIGTVQIDAPSAD